MPRNITSWYPILLYRQKVFLGEEKIVLIRDNTQREISFKNITKVTVQPLYWLLFKTDDLLLETRSGESLKLYNLTRSGTNAFINQIKKSIPTLVVVELPAETEILVNNLFRMYGASDGTRSPLRTSLDILAVVIVAVILFIIWLSRKFLI